MKTITTLFITCMFWGFVNGQTLSKHINFKNITFAIPEGFVNYAFQGSFYILPADRNSGFVISIGTDSPDTNPFNIKNIRNSRKEEISSNGLTWQINNYEGIVNPAGYDNSIPTKAFDSYAKLPNGKMIYVHAFVLLEKEDVLRIFEEIQKSIKLK